MAAGIGPTIVGGSKKHGGADLGPTRAKQVWRSLGVDGRGIADAPPGPDAPPPTVTHPRLTIEMVARLQGWSEGDKWQFAGRKTSQYRQIGNAFPPPVAEAVGRSIVTALNHDGLPHHTPQLSADVHDPVYRALSKADGYVSIEALASALTEHSIADVEQRLAQLAQDFTLDVDVTATGTAYKLGEFRGFTGQTNHQRHEFFERHRNKVS
ncbi:hypothetical protein GCM10023152_24620 [Agromyces bauzanensis]